MSVIKANQSLENLDKAMTRLREALQEPATNSLLIDGTIQRFEFVMELFWKTFKRMLFLEGIETHTPRDTLKGAYQANWIEEESIWLNLLRNRNETSHTYNEMLAREIYREIQLYYPEMERALVYLKQKLSTYRAD